MSLENARQFVNAMREADTYRRAVRTAAADSNLTAFLNDRGHNFEIHDLIIAMTMCMDEMATSSEPNG